jgi:hypothetical protein
MGRPECVKRGALGDVSAALVGFRLTIGRKESPRLCDIGRHRYRALARNATRIESSKLPTRSRFYLRWCETQTGVTC